MKRCFTLFGLLSFSFIFSFTLKAHRKKNSVNANRRDIYCLIDAEMRRVNNPIYSAENKVLTFNLRPQGSSSSPLHFCYVFYPLEGEKKFEVVSPEEKTLERKLVVGRLRPIIAVEQNGKRFLHSRKEGKDYCKLISKNPRGRRVGWDEKKASFVSVQSVYPKNKDTDTQVYYDLKRNRVIFTNESYFNPIKNQAYVLHEGKLRGPFKPANFTHTWIEIEKRVNHKHHHAKCAS